MFDYSLAFFLRACVRCVLDQAKVEELVLAEHMLKHVDVTCFYLVC